jgi:DNA-directed RNA polymerase specialized sigma54-like protein
MTDAEKKCLKVLIKVFESNGYSKDEIYERIKITMQPLTPEQYQERLKFIAQEIGI